MKIKLITVVLAVLFLALPGQAQQITPITGTEVVNLLDRVDNIIVPALQLEIAKENGLGLNTVVISGDLAHIQKVSQLMRTQHRYNEFTLYVLTSNINASWYSLILDSIKLKDTNPDVSQDLTITARQTIEPVALLAANLAYRLIYTIGSSQTTITF
jgi:hypothetical protein